MAKGRYRCTHCGTEGNYRTQQPHSRAKELDAPPVPTSTCRDKIACNARLRARTKAAQRHSTHVNTMRARKEAARLP